MDALQERKRKPSIMVTLDLFAILIQANRLKSILPMAQYHYQSCDRNLANLDLDVQLSFQDQAG